jgi:predicted methyltransferase
MYDHKVDLPEGELDGVKIEKFEVTAQASAMSVFHYGARVPSPGTYTRLEIDGRLVMSDTSAEWHDHLEAVWRIRKPETRRVLINGLGIGMVLRATLACAHIEHVDVVEVDDRVIRLVSPGYDDPRLVIHHDDAYTVKWPASVRWDVVWHDIWPDLCEDNLEGMGKLHRRYGRRAGWQGSWGKELLRSQRRRSGGYY